MDVTFRIVPEFRSSEARVPTAGKNGGRRNPILDFQSPPLLRTSEPVLIDSILMTLDDTTGSDSAGTNP
jgi:hypothetical protein